jgi:hypothetical protein
MRRQEAKYLFFALVGLLINTSLCRCYHLQLLKKVSVKISSKKKYIVKNTRIIASTTFLVYI